MRLITRTLLAALMVFCLFHGLAASAFDDSKISHIQYPDWFNDNPFLDLVEVRNHAVSHHKKGVMVLFTTEGCSYCDSFIRSSLGDAGIAKILQQNFVSIGLEIFDDAEMVDPTGISLPVKQYAYREGVQYAPSLLFYDTEGNSILRLTGYQTPERFKKILTYLQEDHYLTRSLRDYLASDKTDSTHTQMLSDPLFAEPPYVLVRSHFPATKPLLVIFETADCRACEDFHQQVLSDPSIRNALTHFEVVRLDGNDKQTPVLTPDGKRSTPYAWYRSTDLISI